MHLIFMPNSEVRPLQIHLQNMGCWKTLNAQERNGTERNEPEVIDAQYGRGHWTRGQKLALIRTVFVSVRTLILRSVTAAKTEQARAESHVKRMKLLR